LRRRRPKAPDWTEANVHDPGITLLQLLAFLDEAFTSWVGPKRRRARRRRKMAVAALVLVAVWRARANRERPD
jgi:hypothetical protein